MAMTIVEATHSIVGGIDTHSKVHVAAALDEVGGLLGAESFGANPTGYAALVSWFESFGSVSKVGVEGTGSYGAGICRFLARSGIEIIEVDRQNRQARRNAGKSDPLDAVEAARAALSGRASGRAKGHDGWVEALRDAQRGVPRLASGTSNLQRARFPTLSRAGLKQHHGCSGTWRS